VITLLIAYLIAQYVIFKKNDFNMPAVWSWINGILLGVVFIAILAVGIYFPVFSSYTAITMGVWAGVAIVGLCALVLFARDESQHDKDPIFYSPWLLPIYKYKSSKNDIDTHKAPTLMLISCCIAMLLWGIFTTVCIKPILVGVCVTIIAEIAIIQLSIYLIYSGTARREGVEDFVDEGVVK